MVTASDITSMFRIDNHDALIFETRSNQERTKTNSYKQLDFRK